MRCVVTSKALPIDQIEREVRMRGGSNIRVAHASKQVFCEMDASAKATFEATGRLVVRVVGKVRAEQVGVPRKIVRRQYAGPMVTPYDIMYSQQPIYGASQATLSSQLYELRSVIDPPIIGSGATVAVLDTGIRKTHRGLVGKVVHEVNFTDSPSVNDVFSHGTAVAFMIAGGRHVYGEECGIAPGASLMNIKVIGDDGIGTDETVVLGLEELIRLWGVAEAQGLYPNDPMYPNIVNMSIGKPDNDDEDDPIRLGVMAVYATAPPAVAIYAAAGNGGPSPGTVTLPASMAEVGAVGALTFVPFEVWSYSSRGPTLAGLVKPDYSFFGVDMVLASSRGDDSFEMKSGTSFACPAYSGFWALAMDALPRMLPPEFVASLIETPTAQWQAAFGPFLAAMSVKPPSAPIGKDNNYGYGMPLGSLALAQIDTIAGGGTSVLEMLPAMVLMSMLPALMGGMK